MLKFITRDMKSADGLARVYFCCHPDDSEECLDRFSKQLLELTDCAVCFKTDPDGELDEDILQQMQMFFIPVTSSFLNTENTARNREFAFAMEKHIPILPVIADENITPELFNRVCGDIQYIDPYSTSAAGVDYKEKMKAFLNSILVDSEVTEQIKSAFRAYAFLSYRKKDRGYVNDVMKAVHSDSRCDDVAVWYDEYLTPGENFNDNIRINIDKSKAFILLVTPNITESGNFVITNEYPAALEQEKTIIPVEAVNTDRSLLERSFERIPKAVTLGDRTAVSELITENLKLSDEEISAEKNYLLGLAYMSMIDVEKDTQKGISLLNKAADENHTGALERLVSIYENGDGTQKDIGKAVEYQERLIRIKRNAIDGHKSWCEYMDSMLRLGDIYYDNHYGSPNVLSHLYSYLTEEAERNISSDGPDEAVIYYLTAIVRLCEVDSERESYLRLLPAAEKILKICGKYEDSIQTDKFKRCLIMAYTACADSLLMYADNRSPNRSESMGIWYEEQNGREGEKGKIRIKEEAFDIYVKAHKLASELFVKDPQDIEHKCFFIRTAIGLAGAFERFGEYELAFGILQTAEKFVIPNTSKLLGGFEKSMGVNRLFQLRFDSCAVHCEKAAGYFFDLERKKGGDCELLADGLICEYIAAVSDVLSGNVTGAADICKKALSEIGTDESRLSGDVRHLQSNLGRLSELCLTESCKENMREFYLKLYDFVCDGYEYFLGRVKYAFVFIVSDKLINLYGDDTKDRPFGKSKKSAFRKLPGFDAVSLALCNMNYGRSEPTVMSSFARNAIDDFDDARDKLTEHLDNNIEEEYLRVSEQLDKLQKDYEQRDSLSADKLNKLESEINEYSRWKNLALFELGAVRNYDFYYDTMLAAMKFALSCLNAVTELNDKIFELFRTYTNMTSALNGSPYADMLSAAAKPLYMEMTEFMERYNKFLPQAAEYSAELSKRADEYEDIMERIRRRVSFLRSLG